MKKNIIKLLLAVIIVAIISIGTTYALLVKNTEVKTNVFTVGDISIKLDEPDWEKLSDKDKTVYPGKTIPKDPQVTNTGDNEKYADLYVYIEVKIPRVSVKTYTGANNEIIIPPPIVPENLFSFTANPGWDLIRSDISSDEKYSIEIYAYTADIVRPGETTTPLFNEVTMLKVLEGEIITGTKINMPINAYAIQSEYLNESGNNIQEKTKDAFSIYESQK